MQDSEPKINCVIPKQNLQKPSSLREEVPQRNRDSRNGTFALKPYVEDNFIKQTTKAYLENKTTVVDRTKNNIFAKLWKCRRLQDVHIIYEQKTSENIIGTFEMLIIV